MRSNGKKNVTPLSAPYSKRVRRFAPLKVGERNNVSGTIGAGLRASTSRKASRATTPITSVPSTSGVPKPREPASISPYTSAPNPSVPHQSSPPQASGSRLSGTRQNRTASTTAASGTLRKKTQRQDQGQHRRKWRWRWCRRVGMPQHAPPPHSQEGICQLCAQDHLECFCTWLTCQEIRPFRETLAQIPLYAGLGIRLGF